jgi:hypothetical protein
LTIKNFILKNSHLQIKNTIFALQISLILKHFINLLILFIGSSIYSQNCDFTISVPQDITICEESTVLLDGSIFGNYLSFLWTGTNGYSNSNNLTPSVFVDQTTTFTLKVLSDPSVNLIINGDFSAGNSGFTTNYNYMPDLPGNQSELWNEGTYTVVSNPNFVHSNFSPCPDHSGGGDMMVVNGAASLQQVWCQTISVMPNTDYIFQAYATSVNPSSPAILQFAIDGALLGTPFGLAGGTCNWQEFYATWNSGSNTSVEICITNQNTAASGNDFAIDDIFFGELCKEEEEFTVTFSTFELLPPSSPTIDCNNPITELIAIPLPTIPGYQYAWDSYNGTISSNPNLQEISVITSGEYTVTVTNERGCTYTQQYEVSADFDTPDIEILGDLTLDCTQKTTLLTASSNASVFNYNWLLPNFSQAFGNSITATTPGNYEVTAIGTNGCIGLDTVNVTLENSNINYAADSSGVLSCSLKNVDIYLDIQTSIDSISWKGPNIISQNPTNDSISVGAIGYYVYELFLGIDCSVKDSILITELPPSFTYELSNPDTLNCINTSTDISILNTGALSDTKWYFGNQLLTNLDTITINNVGTYYALLTDNNGCTKTDSVIVYGDFALPIYSVTTDSIDCSDKRGQFFTTNASYGNYKWEGNGLSSSDQNPEFTLEGDYTLTVTGLNGCSETSTHFLPSSQNFPSILSDVAPITCSNPTGILNITTTIPSDIEWTDLNGNTGTGNTIFSNISNTYQVKAIANNGCEALGTFTITIDTLRPTLTPIAPDMLTCNQLSATPNVQTSAFDQFKWSGPNFSDSTNLRPVFTFPGNYVLTLINNNGCESSQTFRLTEDKSKPIFSVTAQDLSCKMPETTLNLSGNIGQTYTLTNYNQTIQNGYKISTPGTYIIQAINSLGCDSSVSIVINGNFDKPVIQPTPILLNCHIPTVWASDKTIDPTLTYSWETPQGLVTEDSILISDNQNYVLIAINEYGCESRAVLSINTDFTKPTIEILGKAEIGCNETSTTLSATTNANNPKVNWSINNQNISDQLNINISEAGNYVVNIANPLNGCSDTQAITVTKQPKVENINFEVFQPLCFGEKGSLEWNEIVGGTAPYTAYVNNEIVPQNTSLNLSGGNYQLRVSDSNGCTLSSSFMIEVINDFTVNAGKDTIINLGASHQINATSDIAWSSLSEITWSPANTLSCDDCPNPIASPENDTEYSITILDENGCERTDKVWVRVKFNKGFTAPNIMNPGSSSGNNKFTLYPVFASIETIKSLGVYDRWGNKVFDVKDIPAGDPDYGWNGTFDGRDIQPGVFIWVADVLYKDNTSEIVTGDITIIK